MSPHIKIDEKQKDDQVMRLVTDLLLTCKGQEFDGMTAARHFSEKFGIHADWHLFADILDYMARTGKAECTQGWGHCRYIIL